MRPEQLSAPVGSAPWLATFTQSLIRVLQAMSGNGEPKRTARYADAASLPSARDWQDGVAIVTDIDGLGNCGLAVSDGTGWFNVADGSAL